MPLNFRIFRCSLLVATLVALTQSECALASCGDYLHTKFDRPMTDFEKTPHDLQSPAAEQGVAVDQMMARNPKPVSPCNGPGCRQQREVPSTPFFPAPSTSGNPVDGITGSSSGGSLAEQTSRASCEADMAARRGFPARMDRPPQAGI